MNPEPELAIGLIGDMQTDERGNLMLAARTADGRTIAMALNVN